MKPPGQPKRRTPLPPPDPEKHRAWERRSRRRIPRRSAKRVAEDARTEELRRSVAALPCLLARHGCIDLGDTCVEFGPCAGPGTPHHLEKTSAGGATTPANLVPLCAFHNRAVEDRPGLARLLGLVVHPGIDHAEALRRRVAAGLAAPYYARPGHPDQRQELSP